MKRLPGILLPAVFLLASVIALTGLSKVPAEGADVNRENARVSLLMATGMQGGTFYHVGLGLASFWTTRLRQAGIRVSAAISEGSRENIEAVRIADADLVLLDELVGTMAYAGSGIYRGKALRELRAITNLWPETVNLVVRSERIRSGNLTDLEGLVVASGLPDSGNRLTMEILLNAVKNVRQTVRVKSMSTLSAVEAFRQGSVQALDLTGGSPVPALSNLFHEMKGALALLDVTDAQVEALRTEGWRNVFRSAIAAGTYAGQEKPVKSVAQMSIMATTSQLDTEVVFSLTKTLYEGLDVLIKIHPVCKELSLDKAFQGLRIPLHPGAVLYYRQRGLKVPESLIPQ